MREVWVRGLDGRSTKISLASEIAQFKQEVALRLGVEGEGLRLVGSARELRCDADLMRLRHLDTIDVRLKLSGGGSCVG